jgi:hypothetical protein
MFMRPSASKEERKAWPVLPIEPVKPTNDKLCEISVDRCFGVEFAKHDGKLWSVDEVFKRVAFEDVECGDCLILALVGKSGSRGISAFLPPSSSTTSSPATCSDFKSTVDGVKDYRNLTTFPNHFNTSNIRAQAICQIHRYAFTIGLTPTTFIPMQQPSSVVTALSRISARFAQSYGANIKQKETAMLTLNDDMTSDRMSRLVGVVLKRFFELEWPIPTRWEKVPP